MKKKRITFEKFIEPLTLDEFYKHYYQKKHFVIKADENRFKHVYQWKDFNNYLNGYPRNVGDLQIIDYDDKGHKYCYDKFKKGAKSNGHKQSYLSKKQVFDLWKAGKSFILPLQEYQKKELVDICSACEIHYGSGQANLYCSPVADSKSFPSHADSTDNYLVHVEGKVKWTLYNEFGQNRTLDNTGGGVSQKEWDREMTIMNQYELEAGDLLYIPKYQYHEAVAMGPRISISIHFHDKKEGQPQEFGGLREKWYNWIFWNKKQFNK